MTRMSHGGERQIHWWAMSKEAKQWMRERASAVALGWKEPIADECQVIVRLPFWYRWASPWSVDKKIMKETGYRMM